MAVFSRLTQTRGAQQTECCAEHGIFASWQALLHAQKLLARQSVRVLRDSLLCRVAFGYALFAVTPLHAIDLSQLLSPKVIAAAETQFGPQIRDKLDAWQALVKNNLDRTDSEKLVLVNDFFNQQAFLSDEVHWKQEDYWATPVEFLGSGAGDCEDFAIAKYFTLSAMGVSSEHIRIMYVNAIEYQQAHMVLIYMEEEGMIPLVLDNLIADIKRADQRSDLTPVYSFNGDGLWLARVHGKGRKVRRETGLAQWDDVLTRIERGE